MGAPCTYEEAHDATRGEALIAAGESAQKPTRLYVIVSVLAAIWMLSRQTLKSGGYALNEYLSRCR
jgi:hypothetical protein